MDVPAGLIATNDLAAVIDASGIGQRCTRNINRCEATVVEEKTVGPARTHDVAVVIDPSSLRQRRARNFNRYEGGRNDDRCRHSEQAHHQRSGPKPLPHGVRTAASTSKGT